MAVKLGVSRARTAGCPRGRTPLLLASLAIVATAVGIAAVASASPGSAASLHGGFASARGADYARDDSSGEGPVLAVLVGILVMLQAYVFPILIVR